MFANGLLGMTHRRVPRDVRSKTSTPSPKRHGKAAYWLRSLTPLPFLFFVTFGYFIPRA